jgi:hypothetical protein
MGGEVMGAERYPTPHGVAEQMRAEIATYLPYPVSLQVHADDPSRVTFWMGNNLLAHVSMEYVLEAGDGFIIEPPRDWELFGLTAAGCRVQENVTLSAKGRDLCRDVARRSALFEYDKRVAALERGRGRDGSDD